MMRVLEHTETGVSVEAYTQVTKQSEAAPKAPQARFSPSVFCRFFLLLAVLYLFSIRGGRRPIRVFSVCLFLYLIILEPGT